MSNINTGNVAAAGTGNKNNKNIVIIGCGPIGIECALNLIKQNYYVTIIEKGSKIANNINKWSNVSLFSTN